MSDETDTAAPVSAILSRWEELRRTGHAPTVAGLCAECPELVPEVTRRIEALEAQAASNQPSTVPAAVNQPQLPDVPGYTLEEVIGRGGMGAVFRARHVTLKRVVALKVIAPGSHAGLRERLRFSLEAEALASLRHPNVVQIHEVGETAAGNPFISMEFVAGGSLATKLGRERPTARVAAALTQALAAGADAAHRQGIIHRDLKPGNVLLDLPTPEQPWGVPRIADFGLAKRLEGGDDYTRPGDVLGTPAYLAPEQAEGRSHVAGPAVDVWALGVILYEMLTGRVPFQGGSPLETIRLVATREPEHPSRVRPGLPRDLQVICLKCLAKAPERRYASAGELGADLGRYLAGEPILARPATWRERTGKWVRRNPATAGLFGLSFLTLLGFTGAVVGFWYSDRLQVALKTAEHERRRAEGARDEVESTRRRVSYARDMLLASEAWERGRPGRVAELLDAWGEQRGPLPDLRDWEWHYLHSLLGKHSGRFVSHRPLFSGAVSPDGRFVAGVWDTGQGVELWNVLTGGRTTVPFATGTVRATFSGDGRTLHLRNAQDQESFLVETGQATAAPELPPDPCEAFFARPEFAKRAFLTQSVRADGTEVAGGDHKPSLSIWNAGTGQELLTLTGLGRPALTIALHPTGSSVFWAEQGGTRVERYDRVAKRLLPPLVGPTAPVRKVAFCPDGRWCAAVGEDRIVHVWESATGHPLATFRGHDEVISDVACWPDNKRLATFGQDGRAFVWDVTAPPQDGVRHTVHSLGRTAAAFSPDNRFLATVGREELLVWHGDGRPNFRTHLGWIEARRVTFTEDSNTLVLGGVWGGVLRFDLATKQFSPRLGKLENSRYEAFAVRPGGRGEVASSEHAGDVERWNIPTGERIEKVAVPELDAAKTSNPHYSALAYSADGKRLVLAARDGRVVLWDVGESKLLDRQQYPREWLSVALSRDDRWTAAGAGDGTVTVWAARGPVREFRGHLQRVVALQFLSGDRRLVSASADGSVKLWDVESGLEVLMLRAPSPALADLAVSSDGSSIVATDHEGHVLWWRIDRRD